MNLYSSIHNRIMYFKIVQVEEDIYSISLVMIGSSLIPEPFEITPGCAMSFGSQV